MGVFISRERDRSPKRAESEELKHSPEAEEHHGVNVRDVRHHGARGQPDDVAGPSGDDVRIDGILNYLSMCW